MSLKYNLLRMCLKCNKLFAIKKVEKKLVKTENINMVEALYQPQLRGEIQITAERFVPAKKEVYEITYVCRFCGEKHTNLAYRNIKNNI